MAGPDVALRAGEGFRDLRLPADEHAVLRAELRILNRGDDRRFAAAEDGRSRVPQTRRRT